ncbi:hypothetical protein CERZMDRAFT_94914 [Cercospora zeae-maydis SCOH1-5]|uniref:Uncharacterized protein n=1 Tax=Cercospora zeae-maydis SCOH1-5 TaxID=717836 RepID=A0A6A6FQ08_9PEZI|nr:hypothetical protein CERZMDRAFT_94914 [Cercospora zeae-maydis SCOH1-5]
MFLIPTVDVISFVRLRVALLDHIYGTYLGQELEWKDHLFPLASPIGIRNFRCRRLYDPKAAQTESKRRDDDGNLVMVLIIRSQMLVPSSTDMGSVDTMMYE